MCYKMCYKKYFGGIRTEPTFVCMKANIKANKKTKGKKVAKSLHWSLRIKTPVADAVMKDVTKGKYETAAEAVNKILAGHYGVALPGL